MSRNKLRMFIINLGGGGAERQFIELARRIHPDSIHVVEDKVAYDVQNVGPIYYMGNYKKYRYILKYGRLWVCLFHFRRFLSRNSCLISFQDRENIINILLKLIFRHKSIVSVRNTATFNLAKSRWCRWMVKYLYPYADKVAVNSHGIRQDLIRNFGLSPEKIAVIENGFSVPDLRKKAQDPLPEKWQRHLADKRVILSVGRLVDYKGHAHMVRILPYLVKAHPDTHLVILGKGSYQNHLEKLARSLKVESHLSIVPFASNPYPFYRLARWFVLPSYFEGFPNVLVEAMALGLPVVAADCESGPREILADCQDYSASLSLPMQTPYGVLIPQLRPAETEALTESEDGLLGELLRLIASDAESAQYASQAPLRAAEFSFERMCEKWANVIFECAQIKIDLTRA